MTVAIIAVTVMAEAMAVAVPVEVKVRQERAAVMHRGAEEALRRRVRRKKSCQRDRCRAAERQVSEHSKLPLSRAKPSVNGRAVQMRAFDLNEMNSTLAASSPRGSRYPSRRRRGTARASGCGNRRR